MVTTNKKEETAPKSGIVTNTVKTAERQTDSSTCLHVQVSRRKARPGVTMSDVQREAAKELFLNAFARVGNVSLASRAAGVHRSMIYAWREHDGEFAISFYHAEQEAVDNLEAEARRRAVVGVEKFVVSMGKVVYMDGKPLTERIYSDMLLLNLLKAHSPKFRDRSHVDVTSAGERISPTVADLVKEIIAGDQEKQVTHELFDTLNRAKRRRIDDEPDNDIDERD